MIYVGIDVAKDKHDCCILGSDGEILFSPFTFQNSLQGFDALYPALLSTRYTQIFTEKVKALERRKRIKSMLLRLL